MKKKNIIIILNWFAIAAWLSVIFYFSHQPNLKSDFEPIIDLILRKIAHMAEYFVLAFLLFRATGGQGLKLKPALALSFGAAVIFASLDEFNQASVAGRVGSIKDVGIDALGTLAFAGLKLFERKK